ncbi:GTP-binding protein [Acorus calamus]|uniref:GTP-binding protein n=1 Tax=Acorus calamus TaxID=4465 RepID=A0AAV9CLL4_ACOCL|nr:GTP-binding protein [Acorus calamus]
MVSGTLSLLSCSAFSPSNPVNDGPSPSLPFQSTPLRRRPLSVACVNSIRTAADDFEEDNAISDFMRFRKGEGSGELQTAVVTYKKRFPWSLIQPFLQVDLVSTIHIGDKEYFETLQKELEFYDCVLYEMVASKETLENRKNSAYTKRLKASRSRSRGFNILGCIQRQMARVLSLDFQLDCLDYQGDNWYHADLDYETFKLLQLERGESFFTFARDMTLKSTKAMVQSPSIPEYLDPWRSKLLQVSRVLPMPLVGLLIIGSVCAPQVAEYPELEALSKLDFGAALKIFLAKRLTSETGECPKENIYKNRLGFKPEIKGARFTQVTTSVEEKSVIIGERNRVATEELRRAIDNGCNRIAVLYGGGHMPDLGRRLREEFDMVPSEVPDPRIADIVYGTRCGPLVLGAVIWHCNQLGFLERAVPIPFERLFVPPGVEFDPESQTKEPPLRVLTGSNIVLSPLYARDAQVTSAEFVKSSKRKEDCPADGLPEFALVGRSNVGKSSLLNSIVRRKKLALTSKKPGKTQCINHFKINDSWFLVDLPGYGYAAAPHEVRVDWDGFTKDYFLNRKTLVSVFLLIDASIPAKKIDLDYASWLGKNQIPMTMVFTKCDKRKKRKNGGKRPEENVEDFQVLIREFFDAAPPWIMTSSITNQGRDEMLLHMAQLRNYWLQH